MLKILLLAVAALAVAGPAHAAPVTAALAWVGAALKAATVGAALLRMGIGIGLNLLASVLLKPEKPKVNVQFEVDMGDDTPLSFIVGEYPTAGKRKYIGSWGKNTRYITEVIEISCLPVTGLKAVWFNDELGDIRYGQPAMQSGHLMGYPVKNFSEGVGSGDERDRCWIKLIDGTQSTADAFLISIFGTDPDYPWTSAMIGTGKAYAVLSYYYDPEVMTQIPQVLLQPQPLPLYDPRKDSSTGGLGAHRWGDRSTYEPSTNPAVIAYNISRGIYFASEWVFGGRNLPAWRLPRAEWVAAMNACDRPVNLAGGGTEPAFRCGLQITVDMTPADALEEIGRAANMRFAEVGGMLKPVVGLPGAAVLGITDGDILITEGQSFKPFNSLGETFNALSATYPEPREKWSTKDAPEYIDADSTAEDGGRYLPTSVAYPAAPFARQVQRLMRAQMRDYRRARVHQVSLPPDAYALEPLVDMISWSSQRNGYINKQFVVEEVAKTPGLNVLVTLREVDPSDYDWDSDFELPVSIVTPVPVRPFTQVISGFSASAVMLTDNATKARQSAIRVACSGDEVGVTHIQIRVWRNGAADHFVDVLRPFSEPFVWFVQTVQQRTTYQVAARLISDLTPKSTWTAKHTVTTGAVYIDGGDFVDGVTGLFSSAGLKATRIIANRSTPGNSMNELAWSVADSRLYRWNGTEWIHFIEESVKGILDETAFATSIRIPKLVTALPTSGQRVGDMVILQSDPTKIYTWAGGQWKAEIAADQIVGKLTAVQIGAGAIGTEQLAAGAAVISKLAITDWANLVGDDQIQDIAAWTGNVSDTWVALLPNFGVGAPIAQSKGAFQVTPRPGGGQTDMVSLPSPAKPGEEFFASCRVGATHQPISAQLFVQYLDASGNGVGNTPGPVKTTLAWETIEMSSVAPANTAFVRNIMRVNTGGYASGNISFSAPVLRRKGTGKLVVDGTIQGRHIEFETLTGGLMAAAGIITKAAQIDNAVIGRAHIGLLAVDTARIANLTVSTLKVADGAITAQYAAEVANFTVTMPDTSGLQDVLSLTFTLTQSCIILLGWSYEAVNSAASGTVNGRVFLNATEMEFSRAQGSAGNPGNSARVLAKSLGAGTHTLKLRANYSGSDQNKAIRNASIFLWRAYK
ncbi:phage tail protein [Paracoccus sulfuroxidans]|uniref:Putative tail protein n=1 Tax=Paracoccus sulfuroxidans TaxID=384678 RepID=A0A562NQ36_9RHOB|nr:phage tail protein [Paracoccus sulfuroxidans]AZV00349.1 tail fiber protein [Paracoccus phage vB_PsuS_Psul1]TWI34298.1 putative tail protein [Paracoccus sulfuroxidans]